jgi:demethylmenaquinone methyltransferase/2-methoxy-6-polyprenyl-1,4-benzoquinol methylase
LSGAPDQHREIEVFDLNHLLALPCLAYSVILATEEPGMNQQYLAMERARVAAFEGIWDEDINAVFADVARYYDRANVFATLGLLDWLRARFIDTIDVRPHERVLDVCAGTNVIGIGLKRRQPTLDIFAVDRSAAMQKVGRESARRCGFEINSTICDVHGLPYPDNHFDVVTLQWATRHLRVMDVFAEIHRVLKPGGHFYHCDMLRPANKIVESAYYLYLKACVGIISTAFRSNNAALKCRRYFVDAIRLFYSTAELSDVMAAAGFDQIKGTSLLGGTVGFHAARKANP